MFRTLLLALIPITFSGCVFHYADLDLPVEINRIKVEPIQANMAVYGQQVTDYLKHELAKDFTITDENPDLIISGSAIAPAWDTYPSAVFVFRTQTKKVGIISFDTTTPANTPQQFAKKIKNILTKRR